MPTDSNYATLAKWGVLMMTANYDEIYKEFMDNPLTYTHPHAS